MPEILGKLYRYGVNTMITVSLCMIVKNEEDILARCLDSLKGLMDEKIILTKYMIFHGAMILRLPGTFLFPRLQKNIFMHLMLTRF